MRRIGANCSRGRGALGARFTKQLRTLKQNTSLFEANTSKGVCVVCCVTGRNAVQNGFHPTRKPSTGLIKIAPAVPLSPAVSFCTRVSAGMKDRLGRDSSMNVVCVCACGILGGRT